MGVKMIDEKKCYECHFGYIEPWSSEQRFDNGCLFDKERPNWSPMTNSDAIRHKADDELAAMLYAWNHGERMSMAEIKRWLSEGAK